VILKPRRGTVFPKQCPRRASSLNQMAQSLRWDLLLPHLWSPRKSCRQFSVPQRGCVDFTQITHLATNSSCRAPKTESSTDNKNVQAQPQSKHTLKYRRETCGRTSCNGWICAIWRLSGTGTQRPLSKLYALCERASWALLRACVANDVYTICPNDCDGRGDVWPRGGVCDSLPGNKFCTDDA